MSKTIVTITLNVKHIVVIRRCVLQFFNVIEPVLQIKIVKDVAIKAVVLRVYVLSLLFAKGINLMEILVPVLKNVFHNFAIPLLTDVILTLKHK